MQFEEKALWDDFWEIFPDELPTMPEECKKQLKVLLDAKGGKLAFKRNVEKDLYPDQLSVQELRKAFPSNCGHFDLLQRYVM